MRQAMFSGGPLHGDVLELVGEQNEWEVVMVDDTMHFYQFVNIETFNGLDWYIFQYSERAA